MADETPPPEFVNEEVAAVERLKSAFDRLKAEMGKVIVGPAECHLMNRHPILETAVDVAGVRAWSLPPYLLTDVVAERPRLGFKREFATLWRAEAQAVPAGRAQLLRRYGGIALAIRLAPFAE